GKSEPEPEPEPLHGQLIRELNILDKAHRTGWTIEQNLQTGDAVFSDRAVKLTQVPNGYWVPNGSGLPAIPRNSPAIRHPSP
ncbi:MAG: hypothetical protein IKN55_07605, partial [Oscillospiraceae bacterium]|nr:hypothetical protein [Oscillospiraceae bacterium]